MSDTLLQQPTIPGKVDGIICDDPWQVQCRDCGLVATNPNGTEKAALFIILSRFLFCLDDKVRRCPDCRRAHAKVCHLRSCREDL